MHNGYCLLCIFNVNMSHIRSFVLFFIVIIICLNYEVTGQTSPFFRKDYTFIPGLESFYKTHRIGSNWWDAKKRCALEGAILWIPENEAEVDSVIQFWNKTQPNLGLSYVGITDIVSEGVFESIDGRSIDDLYHKWGDGEPNDNNQNEDCVLFGKDAIMNDVPCVDRFPFICKKSLATVQWNPLCSLPDKAYKYNSEIGKCYKFHQRPKNWSEAYTTCNSEQSYLAIINSQKEANILSKLVTDAPKDKYRGPMNREVIHLGFHKTDGEEWTTIKGVSLEDNGYSKWAESQPDHYDQIDNCGGMSPSAELHDVSCNQLCFFVCEHDIEALAMSLDDRIAN